MKTLIISVQSDYQFPLAEAVRKQIFKEAKLLQKNEKYIEVFIFTPLDEDFIIKDNVKIHIFRKKDFLKKILLINAFDTIWYFGNIGIYSIATSMITPFKCKQMTICDGGVFSIGKKSILIKRMAKFFYFFYKKILVYTQHQQDLLINQSNRYVSRIRQSFPILDQKIENSFGKHKNKTLFYMGHLSEFKGLHILFFIFKQLKKEIPELQLVIANNGIMEENTDIVNELKQLQMLYPADIIIKGKINPYEELSKAHLYIYMFKQPNGTFAFPLSLYESLLCNTPFLGPRIDGVKEFFLDDFLANPQDKELCLKKAKLLLANDFSNIINKNLNNLQRERIYND